MIERRWRGLALAGLMLTAIACDDSVMDQGRPTAVTLSANRTTASIAEPITFRYEAMGARLVGVVVEYGDGGVDSVYVFGAQSATGNLTHAYQGAGTFMATAEAVEFSGETAAGTGVSIEVVEASGG